MFAAVAHLLSTPCRAAPEGDKAVKGQKAQPTGQGQESAKKGKEAIGPKRGSQVCCCSPVLRVLMYCILQVDAQLHTPVAILGAL